jgi:hypothetical protein
MSAFIKKLWNDHGMLSILIPVVGVFILYKLFEYFTSKGSSGHEAQTNQTEKAYKNGATPQQVGGPADASEFRNEDFASVGGAPSQPVTSGLSSNPRDLLPTDTNSEWAKLNPVGTSQQGGELGGINFLKAGYQIGINTVSQSMRNANQQLRSDPVIPKVATGPWLQSTIENDFMQTPFEIGQGPA